MTHAQAGFSLGVILALGVVGEMLLQGARLPALYALGWAGATIAAISVTIMARSAYRRRRREQVRRMLRRIESAWK